MPFCGGWNPAEHSKLGVTDLAVALFIPRPFWPANYYDGSLHTYMATSHSRHTYDAVQSNFSECHPWYAVQVQTRFEQAVANSLRNRGYRDFLPVYTCMRRWSDRVKKVELPLFPGYLFCRFDVNYRLPILTTPGVIGIVGVGKLPKPVEEDEISALQTVAGSGLLLEPWPFLKTGERVKIEDGPLRNVEGILSEIGDGGQLVVSITLLQRSVAVTIDRSWVRPITS